MAIASSTKQQSFFSVSIFACSSKIRNDFPMNPGSQFTFLAHFRINDVCGSGMIDRTYVYGFGE
jgi:hypothetical protein